MMLHLVSRSPFADSALSDCLACMGPEDNLLLFQDAVVAACHAHQWSRKLAQLSQPVFALREDLLARGLTEALIGQVTAVDYAGFVRLTLQREQICSW